MTKSTHTSVDSVETLTAAATEAWKALNRLSLEEIANGLKVIAKELEAERERILHICEQETSLSIVPRLEAELGRTISVLREFSTLVGSGGVSDARIVTADENRKPFRRPDLRLRRNGIGPVVVIEASNFPLAFGVAGGDTASALAARCPVIVKAHPLHTNTSRLIADCVSKAISSSGLPAGTFACVFGEAEIVESLVSHPAVKGVAFTGSRNVGRSIMRVAARRERPLDELSLEMGSVNPVFICKGALGERPGAIAEQLAASVVLGGGQFCTCPGVIFVRDGEGLKTFQDRFVQILEATDPVEMLAPSMASNYLLRCETLEATPEVKQLTEPRIAIPSVAHAAPRLFLASEGSFARQKTLREEVFGPACVIVCCDSDFHDIAELFEGELTASIHGNETDMKDCGDLVDLLCLRVGRLLFNGVPTGVEVCDALNHGGPWPAAYGRFTVVGPRSVERWLRPICYQDAPDGLLPCDLQRISPKGLHRHADG